MTFSKSPIPPQNQPTPPGGGSTLAGLTRPGLRVVSELVPVEKHYVLFDLRQIGEALSGWAGLPPIDDPANLDALIAELGKNKERARVVREQLDQYWTALQWKGAMLLQEWKDAMQPDLIRQFEESVREGETCSWSMNAEHPSLALATEPALVLNVLARSRHSLLMMTAPVAFDKAYLTRQLLTADERMFRLVTKSGSYRVLSLGEPSDALSDAAKPG